MRIMHIHEKAGFFGGVEQILHDTAVGLAARGWQQALLHADAAADPEFLAPFSATGSKISLLEQFKPDAVLIHKPQDQQSLPMISQQWPTLSMVHDHDLVCMRRHKYFPMGGRSCNLPAGRACYTNLCFVNRNPNAAGPPLQLRSVATQKLRIRQQRHIKTFIVGSQWMRNSLAINGIDERKVHVVPPIPECLSSATANPASGEPEILFVGQVVRGKGVDLLLQALAITPGNWHASIVGDGNHLAHCRKLAQKLNIDGKVTFTGRVCHGKLDSYYHRSLFTVVPSRWPEPFGMVGIEAMSRGRPVVGFAAGGISDWLQHQENGLLVPEANIAQLAHAMMSLLQNPSLAATLGANAARMVALHYRHDHYLDQMSTLLEAAA